MEREKALIRGRLGLGKPMSERRLSAFIIRRMIQLEERLMPWETYRLVCMNAGILKKPFLLFVSNISWPTGDNFSCHNPMNNVILSLSKKGIELEVTYERYKDSDPTIKNIRNFINKSLPFHKL